MQGVPTLNPVAGFSNAPIDSFGARFPTPLWPGSVYTWFSDFDRFYGAADSGQADWLTIAVNASTAAVSDAFGGVLLLTTDTAENDGISAQWQGMNPDAATPAQVAETFTFVAGKELWFACRFQLSEVTQSDFMIGLANATQPDVFAATDGVWLQKVDGSAVLTLESKIVTPVTATDNLATLTAATWYEAAFHYNGVDAINAYLDGSFVGSVGISALPTTELALTFAYLAGSAGAKTAQIDWIYAARER